VAKYTLDLNRQNNAGSKTRTGSWNVLTDHKIYKLDTRYDNSTTGNIETTYVSSGKRLFFIDHSDYTVWGSTPYDRWIGSISIFSDKYDLEHIQFLRYQVSGTISMLGNLQKLKYVYLCFCGGRISGAKTDLYNRGANCTERYAVTDSY